MKAKLVQLEAVFWSRLEDLSWGSLREGLQTFLDVCREGLFLAELL